MGNLGNRGIMNLRERIPKPKMTYLIRVGRFEREFASVSEIAAAFDLEVIRLKARFSNAINASKYDIFRTNGFLVTVLRDGVIRANGKVGKTGSNCVWRICTCGNAYKTKYLEKCENCLLPKDKDWLWEIKKYSTRNKFALPGIEKVTDSKGLMINNYTIDHIVPMWLGRKLEYSPIEMSSIDNLQIMSSWDNSFIGGKGTMMPEDWIRWITDKEWYYSVTGDLWFPSLLSLCGRYSIQYIKAASAFIKTGNHIVKVKDMVIKRCELAEGTSLQPENRF